MRVNVVIAHTLHQRIIATIALTTKEQSKYFGMTAHGLLVSQQMDGKNMTEPLTEKRYQELRAESVEDIIDWWQNNYEHPVHCEDGDVWPAPKPTEPFDREEAKAKLKFTCDTCDLRYTCEYALDPYNLDGDCLASK